MWFNLCFFRSERNIVYFFTSAHVTYNSEGVNHLASLTGFLLVYMNLSVSMHTYVDPKLLGT